MLETDIHQDFMDFVTERENDRNIVYTCNIIEIMRLRENYKKCNFI